MEKKIETIGTIDVIWGLYGGNGKEHGNYRDYRGYMRVIWG